MPWGRPEHFIWCRRSAEWKRGRGGTAPPVPPGRRLGEKPGEWPGCGHPASAGRRNAPPSPCAGSRRWGCRGIPPGHSAAAPSPKPRAAGRLHCGIARWPPPWKGIPKGKASGWARRKVTPCKGRAALALQGAALGCAAWVHVLSRRAGVSPPPRR